MSRLSAAGSSISTAIFDDPEIEGHVGDVEVWHPCEGSAGFFFFLAAGVPACREEDRPDDRSSVPRMPPGGVDGVCEWDIFIVNSGTVTFNGPLTVTGQLPDRRACSGRLSGLRRRGTAVWPDRGGIAATAPASCWCRGSALIGVLNDHSLPTIQRTALPAVRLVPTCSRRGRFHQQRGLRRPARAT